MSASNCCFLTCIQISQEAGQVVWYSPLFQNFPQFIVIHTVKDFGIVNKAEVDVFLELSCFFDDPVDVGNLLSGSSAFSKTSLNIWNFTVHVLSKSCLKNFEHYFASMWDECNCVVVWMFLGIAFLWDWNENWSFPVLWPLLSFPHLLAYWVQHFHSIIFRIWNSSAGIPSPPLALFVVMFLRPTWLHILGCLALGKWSHHHGYLGHEDLFCVVLLCILSCHIFLISSAYVMPIPFLFFTWNVPLVSLIFLKRSLVFPILLFSSLSLHWSLRKAFLSLLAILWNSVTRWIYLSFSSLPFTSLLYSAIFEGSSDNHFAFLHFFFLGMVLITASCTMSWTSVHSSSGTLSIRSNPLNLFVTFTV